MNSETWVWMQRAIERRREIARLEALLNEVESGISTTLYESLVESETRYTPVIPFKVMNLKERIE